MEVIAERGGSGGVLDPDSPLLHHGLVRVANQYRWCSAAWFERTATPAQVRTIYGFKTDQVNVLDDFDPV